MKDIKNKILLVAAMLFLVATVGLKRVQAQNMDVSFQLFYDELSPYGEWIDDPDYGYVWLPDVDQNFHPYSTDGRWVNTEYGNTWLSDYEWGWAPFHYGRWHYSNRYGWGWVPGYEWGPAWVSWRQGGGQYGWAPLGPGVNVSINVNIPLRHWVFVPQRYFFSPSIYRYYTPYRRYNSFYGHTTIINNTYIYNNRRYYSGPARRDLARVTRSNVRVYNVSDSRRPGRASVNSRSVSIYRPNIDRNSRSAAKPARVASRNSIERRPTATATRTVRNNGSATNNSRVRANTNSNTRTRSTEAVRPTASSRSTNATRPNTRATSSRTTTNSANRSAVESSRTRTNRTQNSRTTAPRSTDIKSSQTQRSSTA